MNNGIGYAKFGSSEFFIFHLPDRLFVVITFIWRFYPPSIQASVWAGFYVNLHTCEIQLWLNNTHPDLVVKIPFFLSLDSGEYLLQ